MTASAPAQRPVRPESWAKDAQKYLLPEEQDVIGRRRHWAVLIRPTLRALPFLVLGTWVFLVDPDNQVTSTFGLLLVLGVAVYLGLRVSEWWRRHFLITRRRVLLTSGVLVRTLAVMPLKRITDLTWKQTPLGQLLGYGTFRFESAGQDQALSEITFLPDAGRLYEEISRLLFGQDWVASDDEDAPLVAPPTTPAPERRPGAQPGPRADVRPRARQDDGPGRAAGRATGPMAAHGAAQGSADAEDGPVGGRRHDTQPIHGLPPPSS